MAQYQGSPTSKELEIRILRVANALRRSVDHQPRGLTIGQAGTLSDDVLLRIRGIETNDLALIRRLARFEKDDPITRDTPRTLQHGEVATLREAVNCELRRIAAEMDSNPDYVYVLRQTDAVLRDLMKFCRK